MTSRSLDSQIPFGKTLHPSESDMRDFRAYTSRLLTLGELRNSGFVKLVLPPSFRRESLFSVERMNQLKIVHPIEQHVRKLDFMYETTLIPKKSMTFREYRARVDPDLDLPSSQVEALFWAGLHKRAPLYGADIPHTLFSKASPHPWNLHRLPSVLSDILNPLKLSLPGINTPYLYIGSPFTFFAFHTEDYELSSLNYMHNGAPKFWYCIHPKDKKLFEKWVKTHCVEQFVSCPQFFRHKTLLINPYELKRIFGEEITIEKHMQREGEMIVTFSGAYHMGFNWGINVAESVNFGGEDWLAQLYNFRGCRCDRDNLRMDLGKVEEVLGKRDEYKNKKAFLEFRKGVAKMALRGKKLENGTGERKSERKSEQKSPKKGKKICKKERRPRATTNKIGNKERHKISHRRR